MAEMKSVVKWNRGMQFVGQTGSGHSLVMDGAPEVGGENTGMRPMEMVLLGLGGCTAMDVVFILRRARQPVEDCTIEVVADRAETVPKVFTKAHLHYVVVGKDLDEGQVQRAVELSAEKYCSVSQMLRKAIDITYDYEMKASVEE